MAEKLQKSIQRAYLLMGGNMNRPERQLMQARQLIHDRCGPVLLSGSLFESAAWGPIPQPNFLNQALIICPRLSPENLMAALLQIEQDMGRIRTEKMGPRTIDIDILLIDDQVIQLPNLVVPHPLLTERRFALMPLEEIAPFLLHPITGKTIRHHLHHCTDSGDVQKKPGWLG